jgi:hypothetical protein
LVISCKASKLNPFNNRASFNRLPNSDKNNTFQLLKSQILQIPQEKINGFFPQYHTLFLHPDYDEVL